ncbi:MAG: hypothetical protein RhofKO_27130 [Rhodothermales bacterium]
MPGRPVVPEGILDFVQDSVLIYHSSEAPGPEGFNASCTYLNPSAERALGHIPGCQVGSSLRPPDATATVLQRAFYDVIVDALRGGEPIKRQFYDGHQHLGLTAIPFAQQVALTVQLAQQDTERYADVYHRTPVMLHSIDREGRLVQVSDHWLAQMGYTREEVLGRRSTDFLTEASKVYAREVALPEFFSTGRCTDVPYQLIRKDGSEMDVLLSAIALYDSNGEINQSLAVLVDVTQQVWAKRQLAVTEAQNRALVKALPDLIFVFDGEGIYQDYFAPSDADLLLSPDDFLGKSVAKVLPEPLGRASLEAIQTVFRTGEPQLLEYPLPSPGGPDRYFEARIVRQDSRTVLAISREITERMEARHRLEQYAKDLEQSNRALERFAYVSSHDLQEPLRTIHSFTDLFIRRYGHDLDDRGREYLNFVTEGTRQMRALIDDLLAFSRVRGARLTVAEVDLNTVVAAVQQTLRAAIDEHEAHIVVAPLPTIQADEGQIRLLVQNLLSNALKFQPLGNRPHIHLSAERKDDTWAISIRDNGIGIEPAYLDQIFDAFKRLHNREIYSGTGVGLAICQRIVERHGGTLRVESAPSSGSTFTFTLPA